jgi:cell wall-associated NlpC family hydrolase
MLLPAPTAPSARPLGTRRRPDRLASGCAVAAIALLGIVSVARSGEPVAVRYEAAAEADGPAAWPDIDQRLGVRPGPRPIAGPPPAPGPVTYPRPVADPRPTRGPPPTSGPLPAPGPVNATGPRPTPDRGPLADLELHHLEDPHRTVVRDVDGAWIATFTEGARTVTLAGPERRFDEEAAADPVSSTTWVRVLDAPYRGEIDGGWLAAAREDTSPDVLEVAAEYLPGAPEVRTDDGTLVSGEATYGPLDADGNRPVGADWNDYQQATASYGAGVDRHVRRPTRARSGSMDCSGYVRMVFGVRHPVPLTSRVDGGDSLPRISRLQAREAPGVVPVPDRGPRAADEDELDSVRPGDLVFFDAGDGRRGIDHVGIYLGTDEAGGHRFISSRRSSNGPTMGDRLEDSLLDGDGLFARTFVATRRL